MRWVWDAYTRFKEMLYHVIAVISKRTRFLTNNFEKVLVRCIWRTELATLVAVVAVTLFTTFFIVYGYLQHITFKTYAFDLGIYMQALYTTAFEGMLLYETPDLYFTKSGSFFGVHYVPLALALVPIYRLFPFAETLIIIQSLAIGLSAIFLYLLARDVLKLRFAALTFLMSYLLNPHIHSALMFPFHIEVFVPLFSIAALYYLHRGDMRKFAIFNALLAQVIDFAILIAGAIALYAFIIRRGLRERIVSGLLLVYSVTMIYVAATVIEMFGPPALSGGGLFPILGSNWREILVNLITRWDLVLKAISYDLLLKVANFFTLIAPYTAVIFNDLCSWIPFIPYLAINFLTQLMTIYLPGWHIQGLFAIPFAVYIGIMGFRKVMNKGVDYVKRGSAIIALISLVMMFLLSPTVMHEDFVHTIHMNTPLGTSYFSKPEFGEKIEFIHRILKHIPPDASILAQNHIFPHVANRVRAYVWVPPNEIVDFAIADLTQHDYYTKHGDVPFNKQFEELLIKGYEVCVCGYGVILIGRSCTNIPKLFVPFKTIYTANNITAGFFEIVQDPEIGKVLRYTKRDAIFVFGPYTTLPPGTYKVTFWVKVLSVNEGYLATVDVVTDLGKTVLASRPLYGFEIRRGEWIKVELTFSTKTVLHQVEFRVVDVSNNVEDIYLARIEVEQLDLREADIRVLYLTHRGLIVKGGAVVNGIILHKVEDPGDVVWYGPYLPLSGGNYTAVLALKFRNIANVSTDVVMRIDVVVERGTKRLAIFDITRDSIDEGVWMYITLRFALDRSYYDIEIRGLDVAEGVEVSLAYIKLVRDG